MFRIRQPPYIWPASAVGKSNTRSAEGSITPILYLPLVAGCGVPEKVHQQDQARISELLSRITELQNQIAAILATQRVLECAVVLNGVLLAVCLAVLWLRVRRKGGAC